ncbi:VOC family protein [Rapidithrix thailandica]|uniref:VOC family protein n=1 Tax=Rapidithrix thailandica TaxID=413964 RepID=A0AAW9SDS1_9BACT
MEQQSVTLTPYLSFEGNCEEALNFYSEIFQGKVEVVNRYDNPAMKAPAEYREKVLHAYITFGAVTMYASDVFPGKRAHKSSGDMALSLDFSEVETAKKVFEQLSEEGETGVLFAKQFWGDWHGNLIDRYGIRWMINVTERA